MLFPDDCFSVGAGHSSTSISAALGYSVAKTVLGKARNNCIAVIGDGAITGGMAYEAMNNANYLNARMITVLNDNGQVSLPTGQPSAGGVVPAGALSAYTSRLLSSSEFKSVRDVLKGMYWPPVTPTLFDRSEAARMPKLSKDGFKA